MTYEIVVRVCNDFYQDKEKLPNILYRMCENVAYTEGPRKTQSNEPNIINTYLKLLPAPMLTDVKK